MQCGLDSALWYHVRRALLLLEHRSTRITDDLSTVLDSSFTRRVSSLSEPHNPYNILGSIRRTEGAKYSVRHDRIFALLGLWPQNFAALIKVDYSLPIFDVFCSVCTACIARYKKVCFLSFCDIGEHEDNPGKPSLVPNWSGRLGVQQMLNGFADGDFACEIVPHVTISALALLGVVCDSVEVVSESAPIDGDTTPTLRRWNHSSSLLRSTTNV
ncbi:hypothetical protein K458DRAFT_139978 [Lentithecium fluviatile CBS 122367]|uniref:Uncharacterized protein n=1 Tax=Lentithecium fluviatile CBS 122367 TaxID=1168545 RepID=A0A6G1IJ58_9PLEO|nr:hypothetical protein K458DRAFT_139978 [Lentithecium fluviatile CBS 122367]